MKSFASITLSILCCIGAQAQNQWKALVRDSTTGTPVPAASVYLNALGKKTDDEGRVVFQNLPDGHVTVRVTASGYFERSFTVVLPDTSLTLVLLSEREAIQDPIIISTTRSNQRIENAPLKVEVLGKEELDEENTIRPANIASILGDVSGIQIQQSSAVSGNANVRIQGLEGRYTQILRDGMPLFEGFSGNFGVLSIPPLDLRQIELVKGSASTLYGGGAIGGLINLISRRPSREGEAVLTLNQTTLRESDANFFLSKRNDRWGGTLYGGYVRQGSVDVNQDGFTDLPFLRNVVVHPRLFFYPGTHTTLAAGYTGTFEVRDGGNLQAVRYGDPYLYFEKNETDRHNGELLLETEAGKARITVKGLLSDFGRTITTNSYRFKGRQLNYFSEASVLLPARKADWVAGINVIGDRFQKIFGYSPLNGFSNRTAGAFMQHTWRIQSSTVLESGLRLDHHVDYGNFLLPRLALFHRFTSKWAARAGFGMGYKTPNPLEEQNVDYAPAQIMAPGKDVHAERSYGFNAEVNYKVKLSEEASFFINQAFFLTRIHTPVIASELPFGAVVFSNAPGPLVSKGSDTYVQLEVDDYEIYLGYTFTLAKRNYLPGKPFLSLTPRNRMAFTLVKEWNERWRSGLEGSYTGPQYRDGDTRTPGYLFVAAMLGYNFTKNVSLVLNGENLLDYRQSRQEPLYEGSPVNPHFKPLWAPIDGRVINLSLRLKK